MRFAVNPMSRGAVCLYILSTFNLYIFTGTRRGEQTGAVLDGDGEHSARGVGGELGES